MIEIGVLASGGGSNFESLAKACRDGRVPGARMRVLVTNKPAVGALARAVRLGVESLVIEPKDFDDRNAYYDRVAAELKARDVKVVCLAGFLLKVEPGFLGSFPGRVLNIHPALLPKFGGKGMFGHHVHEAVLAAGETVSGCTVHVVDDHFDHGPTLAQAQVPVFAGDTPETLAARVLIEEHRLYPETLARFVAQETL
jgi:phosphoribosylglycinamide formyltransferase-1